MILPQSSANYCVFEVALFDHRHVCVPKITVKEAAFPLIWHPMVPPSSARLTICLMSGHQIVLAELKRILEPGFFTITTFKVPDQKGAVLELPPAAVYVIDAEGVAGPLSDIVSLVIKNAPTAQLLVLAEALSEQFAFPLLNMGVKGLITLDVMPDQLPRAIEALASGGFWVPRGLLATFVDSVITRSRQVESSKPVGTEISRREQDIVGGLLLNLSNKEIANKLNISERTVKFHVSNLLTKFNVQRRADLILLWYQQKTQNSERAATSSSPRRVQ
jgi:DNA-binding NarL/FixJ family response regulator